jgi:fructose-1,6-bisphosphatase
MVHESLMKENRPVNFLVELVALSLEWDINSMMVHALSPYHGCIPLDEVGWITEESVT